MSKQKGSARTFLTARGLVAVAVICLIVLGRRSGRRCRQRQRFGLAAAVGACDGH